MIKNIKNLGTVLSKEDQKTIQGGFLLPINECCICVFRPANSLVLVLITQSCSVPCPQNGSSGGEGGVEGFGC